MQLSQALPEALRKTRAVEVLERSLAGGRLGHGILLHGERMSSLEEIVTALCRELLRSKGNPLEHPDCFILRPSGKARFIRIGSEAERQRGEWPQNTMRRLIIDLQKSSNQGGRKVGIVYDADRMMGPSANAFLKTLEEPPDGTTLFLLTTRPYDLLDTIRSRCLNFRIPAHLASVPGREWSDWLERYRRWLIELIKGPSKERTPHLFFAANGLNVSFQSLLEALTAEAWKTQKTRLPDTITEEEIKAMEVGISRGFRTQLFGEIERATARFTRDLAQANEDRVNVAAYEQSIQALERSVGLLELNFNPVAALELFFLQSLRIWVAARQ